MANYFNCVVKYDKTMPDTGITLTPIIEYFPYETPESHESK